MRAAKGLITVVRMLDPVFFYANKTRIKYR